jgi:hypothetical protein
MSNYANIGQLNNNSGYVNIGNVNTGNIKTNRKFIYPWNRKSKTDTNYGVLTVPQKQPQQSQYSEKSIPLYKPINDDKDYTKEIETDNLLNTIHPDTPWPHPISYTDLRRLYSYDNTTGIFKPNKSCKVYEGLRPIPDCISRGVPMKISPTIPSIEVLKTEYKYDAASDCLYPKEYYSNCMTPYSKTKQSCLFFDDKTGGNIMMISIIAMILCIVMIMILIIFVVKCVVQAPVQNEFVNNNK